MTQSYANFMDGEMVTTAVSPLAPFGGHKQSGFGAEYGIEGLKEFTYSQVITVKREAVG